VPAQTISCLRCCVLATLARLMASAVEAAATLEERCK
jgi:hypothetical protein